MRELAVTRLMASCLNGACRHTALIKVWSYPAATEIPYFKAASFVPSVSLSVMFVVILKTLCCWGRASRPCPAIEAGRQLGIVEICGVIGRRPKEGISV